MAIETTKKTREVARIERDIIAASKTGKARCLTVADILQTWVNYKGIQGSNRWLLRYPSPTRPKGSRPREYSLGTYVIAADGEISGVTVETALALATEGRNDLGKSIDPADKRAEAKQKADDTAEDARRVEKGLAARDSLESFAREYAAKKIAGDLAGIGESDEEQPKAKGRRRGRRKITGWKETATHKKFLEAMENDVFHDPENPDRFSIGNMNARDITSDHVYQVLARIDQRGSIAQMNKVRKWLEAVFEMLFKRRLIEENPVTFLGADQVAKYVGNHQPGVTTARKFQDVLVKLAAYRNREPAQGIRNASFAMARAIDLQVLIFQRPHMIAEMRKDYIDWDGSRADDDNNGDNGPCIYYPYKAMKLKPEDLARRGVDNFHVIPLSPQAAAILREQCDAYPDSEYVFPAAKKSKDPHMHSGSLNNGVQRALGAPRNLSNWVTYQSAHGFRPSARTMAAAYIGIDPNALESILAHIMGDTALRKAYDRNEYLHMRRDAMERWANWVDDVRAGKLHAMTLPKSSLSEAMRNRHDAQAYRELEASGDLAKYRAWQAAQAGELVAAQNTPIIRADENKAANNHRNAA